MIGYVLWGMRFVTELLGKVGKVWKSDETHKTRRVRVIPGYTKRRYCFIQLKR